MRRGIGRAMLERLEALARDDTLNSSAFYAADVQRLVLALEARFAR